MARNFAIIRVIRKFQEDFLSDGEVSPLLSCKIFFDELAVRAAKVIDGVGQVLTDVYLAIWIGDLVNNLHYLSPDDLSPWPALGYALLY